MTCDTSDSPSSRLKNALAASVSRCSCKKTSSTAPCSSTARHSQWYTPPKCFKAQGAVPAHHSCSCPATWTGRPAGTPDSCSTSPRPLPGRTAVSRSQLSTTGVTASGRDLLDGQRAGLRDLGCVPLRSLKHGSSVWIAGSIVARQKPPTARGFAFFVLQDGSERVQVIISPDLWEAHRQLLRDAGALIVYGQVTRQGRAVTLSEG